MPFAKRENSAKKINPQLLLAVIHTSATLPFALISFVLGSANMMKSLISGAGVLFSTGIFFGKRKFIGSNFVVSS